MEQKINTSFIPKRNTSVSRPIGYRRPFGLFRWIVSAIFVITVLSAVGLFVYEKILIRQHAEKKLQIQAEIEEFEPSLTDALGSVKDRIDSGKGLLSDHLSLSSFFLLLESLTVRSVYFSDVTLTALPGGSITLEASGEAPSYTTLAFQATTFKQASTVSNPMFSGININELGRVDFTVQAKIDPRVVLYSSSIPESVENENLENPEPENSGEPDDPIQESTTEPIIEG